MILHNYVSIQFTHVIKCNRWIIVHVRYRVNIHQLNWNSCKNIYLLSRNNMLITAIYIHPIKSIKYLLKANINGASWSEEIDFGIILMWNRYEEYRRKNWLLIERNSSSLHVTSFESNCSHWNRIWKIEKTIYFN